MKKSLLFLLMASFVCFTACSDDDDNDNVTPEDKSAERMGILTDGMTKAWKISEMSIDGQDVEISDCYQDEWFLFNSHGIAHFVNGEVDCNETDFHQTDEFTFEFVDYGDNIILDEMLNPVDKKDTMHIISLTSTMFNYWDHDFADAKVSTNMKLVPVVTDINTTIPENLAGVSSKLWKFNKYFYNDNEIEITETMADEMLLFNRDGSGRYIFGEMKKGDETDTMNNDHFTFEFMDNMIIVHDMHNSALDTMHIVTLEANKLIYEDYDYGDSSESSQRVELIPVY